MAIINTSAFIWGIFVRFASGKIQSFNNKRYIYCLNIGQLKFHMDFAQKYNAQDPIDRYAKLPVRIFLDTNIVQYMSDFGEYIFENYLEGENLVDKRNLPLSPYLANEIEHLRELFLGIDRSPYHFALSLNVYEEVLRKKDGYLTAYFKDLWQYWQAVLWDMGDDAFTGLGEITVKKIKKDTSIASALSKKDFQVFCDAVELECHAILTCDKYRKRQDWIYDNYKIMVLSPSDLMRISGDFQPLWC